jgi:hypothetical protein
LQGYKAVVESFAHFEKAIPMMMTAAGTILQQSVGCWCRELLDYKQLQLQNEWVQ